MILYDISLTIHANMITYPSNPTVQIQKVKSIPKDSSNVSLLNLGTHTGTHVDAPRHVSNKGSGVDKLKPSQLYGACQVLDFTRVAFGKGISLSDIKRKKIETKIVLLKTKNSLTGYRKFIENFIYLTPEAAKHLAKIRVITVGIDYLSIQKYKTGYCAAHCELLLKHIAVFEGLDLSKVSEGKYDFIGMPLKLKDADGAPARVFLVKK